MFIIFLFLTSRKIHYRRNDFDYFSSSTSVKSTEADELITLSFQATTTVDNIDFQEDTDGKRTLHATMSVAYQERSDNDDVFQCISISQGADENTLACKETERRLLEYLAQKILHKSWDQTVVVAWNDKVTSSSSSCAFTACTQEETDTKIIFHAIQLPNDITLDVHSPDTDVLVLLLRFCEIIPSSTRFVCKSQRSNHN